MKVREITDSELTVYASGMSLIPYFHAKALAQSELDKRNGGGDKQDDALSLLDYAWTIFCNAGGGDWDKESEDWVEAVRNFELQWRKLRFPEAAKSPLSVAGEGEAKDKPEQVVKQTCSNCGNAEPRGTCHKCILSVDGKTCTVDMWTPKPTPPAKPDALDHVIATEEYLNDDGKPEPVEPWVKIKHDSDILTYGDAIAQLQRKHDALEAVVNELRKERAG